MLDLFVPGACALLMLALRLLDGWRKSDWPSLLDVTIILGSSWTAFVLMCRALLLTHDALYLHPWDVEDSFVYLRPGDQRYWFFGCISLFLISFYGVLIRFPSLKERLKLKLERDLDESRAQVVAMETRCRDTENLLNNAGADRANFEQRAIRYRGERDKARKELLESRIESSELNAILIIYETKIGTFRNHMPAVLEVLVVHGHDTTTTVALLDDLKERPKPPPNGNGH